MSAELAIAGIGCFVLAVGHTAIGVRWVLPRLAEIPLPGTPFGPPEMTLSMVRFTWHVVGVQLLGFAILLETLALAPHVDARTLLLRWFAALWLAVTAKACWDTRRRPRSLLRFPVPFVFALIAVMSWAASS